MGYQCKILLDSLAPNGKRLTTFEIRYPRFVHSEFMTHRMFSRNSASSRAIPIKKLIQQVIDDPVIPVWWGKQQKGMQAAEEITGWRRYLCERIWSGTRTLNVLSAWSMMKLGMHKQIPNRLLEPWMWITVLVSATEWSNFFSLRCHADAQPEIRRLAELMAFCYHTHIPTSLSVGEWHFPLLLDHEREDWDLEQKQKVSVARCARVSYLTHAGVRDVDADLKLFFQLINGSGGVGHWSPFEHVAQAMEDPIPSGNFVGWKQYRKLFPNEHHDRFEWIKF